MEIECPYCNNGSGRHTCNYCRTVGFMIASGVRALTNEEIETYHKEVMVRNNAFAQCAMVLGWTADR